MNDIGPIARMRRSIEFGRHVGVSRIARRLEINVKRALLDRMGTGATAPSLLDAPARVSAPPLPLFPARGGLQIIGCEHRFTFLDRTIAMGTNVQWNALAGDERSQLWRMNLHYMEYLESVDDATFEALIDSWIAANMTPRREAWRDSFNSYAVSQRTVVWMQQLAVRAGRLPASFVEEAAASLARQIAFLEQNLETDLGGNHLVKNVKALIWASAFFTGTDARRWRTKGLQLLRNALQEQVLSDGVHYERSPSYHCQVFADLLECRHALGDDPFGGALDASLARMAQATADLTHPDGTVALFNDAGLDMAYSPGACLAVYERLLGSAPQPRTVFAFPAAGYYGFRDGDTCCIADCGAVAPDELVAHAHGDVLSFEWTVAGKRIVVDQGVYEYSAGERRQQSRAAAHHNTLCFADADQADYFGAFRCGRRPKVEALAYEARGTGFTLEGTHDGFSHLAGKPRHVRRFEATPEVVTIEDRIVGRADRPAAVALLLHPECEVSTAGAEARVRREDVVVAISCTVPWRVEPAVWWPDMGVEMATHRLKAVLVPGQSRAVTTLRVLSRGSARSSELA